MQLLFHSFLIKQHGWGWFLPTNISYFCFFFQISTKRVIYIRVSKNLEKYYSILESQIGFRKLYSEKAVYTLLDQILEELILTH